MDVPVIHSSWCRCLINRPRGIYTPGIHSPKPHPWTPTAFSSVVILNRRLKLSWYPYFSPHYTLFIRKAYIQTSCHTRYSRHWLNTYICIISTPNLDFEIEARGRWVGITMRKWQTEIGCENWYMGWNKEAAERPRFKMTIARERHDLSFFLRCRQNSIAIVAIDRDGASDLLKYWVGQRRNLQWSQHQRFEIIQSLALSNQFMWCIRYRIAGFRIKVDYRSPQTSLL